MSELKAHRFWDLDEIRTDAIVGSLYYLKSEADKVIRHHKYKRCLAMAKWCEAILNQYPSFGEISAEERRLDKWCKRWLELAKKFKEVK